MNFIVKIIRKDSHYDVAQLDPGLYESACLVIRSSHRSSPSPVPGAPRTARVRHRRGTLPTPYAHVPTDHAAQHHSATCKHVRRRSINNVAKHDIKMGIERDEISYEYNINITPVVLRR